MINSTFGGFMTARQGMAASQHGLNLTGHNLTNSATEGYTRQRIDQVSLNFNGTYRYASQYNVNVGNGVLVTGTSQLRDPFLDLRYRNEVAHVGEQGIKLEVLGDLQSILDEVKNAGDDTLGDGGIFNQLGDVLAKLQQLSNEVGNKEFDNMVKSSCQSLVTLFQSYDKRIQEVEDNLAYDLENVDVPRVNEILKSISELNKTIKSNEIMGDSALELKDQRNLLIDELSNYMKINVLYKPVQVSASTVVDELTISMVGSDGNKYALVADEQYRQLELGDMCNVCTNMPGEYNIGLSALTPVDTELKANLQSAIRQLETATENADPDKLKENYKNAADLYTEKNNIWKELEKAYNDANTLLTELNGKTQGLKDAVKEKEDALKKTKEDLAAKPDDTALQEAVKTAQENVTLAKNTLSKHETDVYKQNNAVNAAKAKQDAFKREHKLAAEKYQAAVDALPSNTTEFAKLFGAWEKNPDTGFFEINEDKLPPNLLSTATSAEKLKKGEGTAAQKIEDAEKAYDAALEALAISEEAGQAIASINGLLVDGSLKGTLEMLNYSGEYDNPPNSIHGIGYFHNMLDTLAYEFATIMNEANNPVDANGDPIRQKNADGQEIIAANYNLFTSNNGEKIDAGNISIAEGWVKNEYGITASQKTDASSGSNDNILHMISLFGKKMNFQASEDLMGTVQINGNTHTLNGMKPGDTITIDGKTFTYVKGATGANGTEFDIDNRDTLIAAGEKQGLNITINNNAITAKTKEKDLSTLISINDKPVSKLSDIDVSKLTYGDTVTIDGKTFTYKPDADETNNTDNVFNSLETLKKDAANQNINIDDDGNGTITSVMKADQNAIDDTLISVDKAPNLNDLKPGDTITIGTGNGAATFTYAAGPLTDDEIKAGKFSNADELMQAAKEQGIDLYADKNTGEITSASTTGSSLFNGTFEEYFTNIGNMLGLDIQSTTEMLDNYTQLASTIAQSREAVTGVSLDEEAMNIMRYQQSYNASARLMTALDEMLTTLISNTGVAGR